MHNTLFNWTCQAGRNYFLAGSDATNMGSGLFFDGRIGRFEVHNVALTDDEIKRFMANGGQVEYL